MGICFEAIVNQGELLYPNPEGTSAVCTLWTPRKRWEDLVPEESKNDVAVVGNLYDPCGVGNIFRNLYANPQVRKIYVVGNDLTGVLRQALLDGMKEGIAIEFEEEKNKQEAFLCPAWVSLHDVGSSGEEEVQEADEAAPSDPQFFFPPRFEVDSLEVPYGGALFHGRTLKEAWDQLRAYIQTFGARHDSQYGATFEILGLTTVVESTGDISGLSFDQEEAKQYADGLLSGEKDPGVSYTYGERLGGLFVDGGEGALTRERVSSRHAFWPVFLSSDFGSFEPPCLVSCWFKERDGKLDGIYVFRSHDMYRGYPLNVYGLRAVQRALAEKLGLECGQSITHSHSAHVYERDYDKELKFSEVPDRSGDCIISVESDHIQVDLIRGGKAIQRFVGSSVRSLERKIHPYLSSVSHAMYIGRELYKAELRLKGEKDG